MSHTCKENDFATWSEVPYVSVCTPTFNRRPFIKTMIECFNHQTYPKDKIEWIIVDDGTDKIVDLVGKHPNVKYYSYDEKMTLGKKRNLMHEKTKGDIIVYMDDDDYYPPERITHSVFKLLTTPNVMCGGSSAMYMFFKHNSKIYKFGPYGDQHSTAGTFAFKKELLQVTQYDNNAALSEEKYFLKNYTIPFVQFDPFKTILVFSHEHNTFDKTHLLNSRDLNLVTETNLGIDYFIKESNIKKFYLEDIDVALAQYDLGSICLKPDVLKQRLEMETSRRIDLEKRIQSGANTTHIMFQPENGEPKRMTTSELVELVRKQHKMLNRQIHEIQGKNIEIDLLKKQLNNI